MNISMALLAVLIIVTLFLANIKASLLIMCEILIINVKVLGLV